MQKLMLDRVYVRHRAHTLYTRTCVSVVVRVTGSDVNHAWCMPGLLPPTIGLIKEWIGPESSSMGSRLQDLAQW
jgi:hypothetical protein